MIKKEQIINAVLDGIIEANNFYERITNGMWITDSPVESIMQTKIAESISELFDKNDGGFLTNETVVMECQFREIFEKSGSGKIRGRIPQLVSGAKRADLVVFNKDGGPMIPIEIKRSASADGFASDAERIIGVLKRSDTAAGGTVKFGLICGFIYGNGDNEYEALVERERKLELSRQKIESRLPDQNFEFNYRVAEPADFAENGWWAGGAICVYLRRNTVK